MTVSSQDHCLCCQYTVDKINLKSNVLYMISVPLTSPISSSISGEIFLLAFPVISMAVFRLAYDMLKVLALAVYFSKRVIWYFIRPTCPCSSHINIFTKASLSSAKSGACLPANQHPFLFPFWWTFMLNLKMYKMPWWESTCQQHIQTYTCIIT